MRVWMEVALILFSCTALIIALYCLFFMVPVKRFWERIRSLGGGLRGIESHVNGVRDEITRRLEEAQKAAQEQAARDREAAQAAHGQLAREIRELGRELDRLRKDMQSLQAELRQAAASAAKATQGADAAAEQLRLLRRDLDVLDSQLREQVRQLVANSFSTVESTVLSALEAVQHEIVYGTARPPDNYHPPRPDQPRPIVPFSPSSRGTPEKIITMQPPLFADLRRGKEEQRDQEDEGNGSGEGEKPEE